MRVTVLCSPVRASSISKTRSTKPRIYRSTHNATATPAAIIRAPISATYLWRRCASTACTTSRFFKCGCRACAGRSNRINRSTGVFRKSTERQRTGIKTNRLCLSLKSNVSERPKADIRFNASINHVCHFIVYDGLKEIGEALNISSRTVQRRVKEYGLPDCTRTNSKCIINPQNTICLFEELSWLY